MTKLTKAIFLSFSAGSNQTSATVNIPFQVHSIVVKAISYCCGTVPANLKQKYAVLTSDLTQSNSPLGIVARDSSYPIDTLSNIEVVLPTPENLQGTYDFYLTFNDNTPCTATVNGDTLSLIVEFNSVEEYM